MPTSRWTAPSGRTASPRRRGAVLERAILDSALDQLSTVGWSGLTMEGVAAGAQTGKAAVYRRWPSKEDLVVDALKAGLPPVEGAPDIGSVREDLVRLCMRARDAWRSRSGSALRSVIYECDMAQAERFQGVILEGVVGPAVQQIAEVVRRGIRRGEVRPEADNEYVLDVIPAMMMYRSKICASEWHTSDIEAMVDQLMIPLLRPTGG